MQYLKSNHVFWSEDHEINDLVNVGDTISFGTIRWTTQKDIHDYYDPHRDKLSIPDGVTLECTSYDSMVTAKVLGQWVRLDPLVRVELNETFEVIEKNPHTFSTPPSNMHSQDGGYVDNWMYKGKSLTRNRFVEFHFWGGYNTVSEAVFLHEDGGTHQDKMDLIYQMANPDSKSGRHPEIDRLMRDDDITLPKFV